MAKAKVSGPTKSPAKSAKKTVVSKKSAIQEELTALVLPVAVRYFDRFSGHTCEKLVKDASDWESVVDASRVNPGLGIFVRKQGGKWEKVG